MPKLISMLNAPAQQSNQNFSLNYSILLEMML